MDDILTNARKIETLINLIEEEIEKLDDASTMKANGIANYDRELAITILKLRNGMIKSMTDENGDLVSIDNLPATLIIPVAKGICYKVSFDKEAGESEYKSVVTKIDARKAQLNGFQSINKVIQ